MKPCNPEFPHKGVLPGLLLFSFLVFGACTRPVSETAVDSGPVRLSPDYDSVTIPPNIAPLNVEIMADAARYGVTYTDPTGKQLSVRARNGKTSIPVRKWHEMLKRSIGGTIKVQVAYRKGGTWYRLKPGTLFVAREPVDPYVAYRLIEPGYESWNNMGIYQRNLETFEERPVMTNTMSDHNCMNCHSFSKNSTETMMFHLRGKYNGTVFHVGDSTFKVNTKTDSTLSAGVYPSWHPSGRYVAYSTNHILQLFHSLPGKKIEVVDTLSDIIVYDVTRNMVIRSLKLSDPNRLETMPSWSPDGKTLYFCSAAKHNFALNDRPQYDLCRIAFNADSAGFGMPEILISAASENYSISFPRVSPDGRYLVFCKAGYGSFTIWHPESDLYMLDLKDMSFSRAEINSPRTESYHSWSSNGRWMVFSSRRIDGLYTRLYLSYFDKNGSWQKPFLIPQRDPEHDLESLKSYNVPELITSKIPFTPRNLCKVVHRPAKNANLNIIK